MQRHYSGKVVNIYMILQQIYSGNYVPNFIRVSFIEDITKNNLVSFFPYTRDAVCVNAAVEINVLDYNVAICSVNRV